MKIKDIKLLSSTPSFKELNFLKRLFLKFKWKFNLYKCDQCYDLEKIDLFAGGYYINSVKCDHNKVIISKK